MPRNKISVRKIKAELRKGPFIKDVHTLGGGGAEGQAKVDQFVQGKGSWWGGVSQMWTSPWKKK